MSSSNADAIINSDDPTQLDTELDTNSTGIYLDVPRYIKPANFTFPSNENGQRITRVLRLPTMIEYITIKISTIHIVSRYFIKNDVDGIIKMVIHKYNDESQKKKLIFDIDHTLNNEQHTFIVQGKCYYSISRKFTNELRYQLRKYSESKIESIRDNDYDEYKSLLNYEIEVRDRSDTMLFNSNTQL